MERNFWVGLGIIALAVGCVAPDPENSADLIIHNGRVYTFSWNDPAPDGVPAPGAPHSDAGWSPDAEAVAVEDGEILFVGSNADAEQYRGSETEVMDVGGATVLPGLIDSHTHVVGLGQLEVQVNLIGAVRGYTIWGAYAGGLENEMGTLEVGKWADITVMDIDPLVVGDIEPGKLFDGNIVATIVGGKVLYKAE